MTQDQALRYWQNMRTAMEAAGDTSSAIYKRALAITEGLCDPLRELPL
jgi:enamine deaminase RidA (YjgF/YER057c/UK114 family)